MKSYLRFLSRNKLYTIIEVVGLSLALAFVIVLSSYIVDDMSVNKALKNTDDIHICYSSDEITALHEVSGLYEKFPEIKESCAYFARNDGKALISGASVVRYADNEINVSTVAASQNFFDFFAFPFAEGDPQTALSTKNSVVLSEEIANVLFPDGDAIGKEINLFENNAYSGYYTYMTNVDVNMIVTGVLKPYTKTIFNNPDIFISIDLFREMEKVNYAGLVRISEVNFVRINEGADIEDLARQLTEEYRKTPNQSGEDPSDKEVRVSRFQDIKKLSDADAPGVYFTFTNIRSGKLFGIYLIMCIFLTVIALLDYVVLTIAFSRFRIKEIATRQLLGTGRKGIIFRCFIEAFALLMVSCFFAILLALGFKEPVGQVLRADIQPFAHLNEYLVLAGILLLMVGLSSAIPSIIISSYSAINILKGEARYKDKKIFGKMFICIAGLLSIGALSILFGITRQTRHLMNQPLGYETDGIIIVYFLDKHYHRYYDELKAQSYISQIGSYVTPPDGAGYSVIASKDGQTGRIRVIEGDREYFDILGIQFLEDFSPAINTENLYLCQSTYGAITEFRSGDMIKYQWVDTPICGTVANLRLGSIKDDTSGDFMGISIFNDFSATTGRQICVKTDENTNQVKKKIRDFYESKGYNGDIVYIKTLEESLREEIQEEQNMLKLLSGFSIICLLMTIMTIIGLSSYYAKTSEKDNAVRNVFGCSKGEMVRKMILDFTLPVVVSALVAIPVAYTVISRWLEGYVIRTENSSVIYLSALAIVLTIVILSVLVQALRMMQTNPSEVLKKE